MNQSSGLIAIPTNAPVISALFEVNRLKIEITTAVSGQSQQIITPNSLYEGP